VIVKSSDVEPVEMLEGVSRRTLAAGGRVMLVQFRFQKGASLPPHSHPHEQAGYVVSGKMKMEIDGDAFQLEAGDSYYVPASAEHRVDVLEATEVVDVFSPPREDYVRKS
jgi:quercetin dioxygenase-like cupin family protein